MNIQQLEYVLAVDRYKHFGKAAEACFVTQPTLSAMIGKLEQELEVGAACRERPVEAVAGGAVEREGRLGGAHGEVAREQAGAASERLAQRIPRDAVPEVSSIETWGTSSSIDALEQMPPQLRELARDVLGSGVVDGWYWALGAAALGLLLAYFLRDPQRAGRLPPDREHSALSDRTHSQTPTTTD